MQCTFHKIHPFKVYNSLTVSIFARLCNPHHYLILKHFHPKKKPHTHQQSLSICPSPPSLWPLLVTFCLHEFTQSRHFISMESYSMWPNLTGMYPSACFQVHPCCSMYQQFTPFYCRVIFHGMHRPHICVGRSS